MKSDFNRRDYEFARHAPKGGYWEHEIVESQGDYAVMVFCVVVAVAWAVMTIMGVEL